MVIQPDITGKGEKAILVKAIIKDKGKIFSGGSGCDDNQNDKLLRERGFSNQKIGLVKKELTFNPFDEIENLALTCGVEVVGYVLQRIDAPHPAYFLGSGKIKELADYANQQEADIIIFDNDLLARQVRNIERLLNEGREGRLPVRVIDRTELILDIFSLHARSKEAKLQVELARLEYLYPRLTRLRPYLSRLAGAHKIGMRGPGEKQLEYDRRVIRKRIFQLKEKIKEISSRKERQIQARSNQFSASIVGYTNAGKTTLFNVLTNSQQPQKNQLFTTLDTKSSLWRITNKVAGDDNTTTITEISILLTDTVGFIRDLPHNLIASFKATLEDAKNADILLVVLDASGNIETQYQAVNDTLQQIDCYDKAKIYIFNKIDLITSYVDLLVLKQNFPDAIFISAKKKVGLDALESKVINHYFSVMSLQRVKFIIPINEVQVYYKILNGIHIINAKFTETAIELEANAPESIINKYPQYILKLN